MLDRNGVRTPKALRPHDEGSRTKGCAGQYQGYCTGERYVEVAGTPGFLETAPEAEPNIPICRKGVVKPPGM